MKIEKKGLGIGLRQMVIEGQSGRKRVHAKKMKRKEEGEKKREKM